MSTCACMIVDMRMHDCWFPGRRRSTYARRAATSQRRPRSRAAHARRHGRAASSEVSREIRPPAETRGKMEM
eukprot:4843927-Pleurochrysis_carterae.AAC.1